MLGFKCECVDLHTSRCFYYPIGQK